MAARHRWACCAQCPHRLGLSNHSGTGTVPRHAWNGEDYERGRDCRRTPDPEFGHRRHCHHPVRQAQDAQQERIGDHQRLFLRQGVQNRYPGQRGTGRSPYQGQEHLRVQQELQRG